MTIINEVKFNNEVLFIIKTEETVFVSINAIKVLFGLNEEDINTQTKIKTINIENKIYCEFSTLFDLMKLYPVKNHQLLNKLQTIKYEKFKFRETDQMYLERIKNICYAIDNKCCLKIQYKDNHERIIEPHSIGVMENGKIVLYAYQISGYSETGLDFKKNRIFYLNKIYNVEILENEHFKIRWNESENYKPKKITFEIKRVK